MAKHCCDGPFIIERLVLKKAQILCHPSWLQYDRRHYLYLTFDGEMYKMATPCFLSFCNRVKSLLASFSEREEVGSSKISSLGECAIARAMAIICLSAGPKSLTKVDPCLSMLISIAAAILLAFFFKFF